MSFSGIGLINRTPIPDVAIGQTPGGQVVKIESQIDPDSGNPVSSVALSAKFAGYLPLINRLTKAPKTPKVASIAIYSGDDNQHYSMPLSVFTPPAVDTQPARNSPNPIASGYVFDLVQNGGFAPSMKDLAAWPKAWGDATRVLAYNGTDYASLGLETYLNRNLPGGVVSLDTEGKILPSLIPALRASRFEIAKDQAEAESNTKPNEFVIVRGQSGDRLYIRMIDTGSFDRDFDPVDLGVGVTSVAGQSGNVTADQLLAALSGLGTDKFTPFTKAQQEAIAAIDKMHLGGTNSVGQITIGTDISFWVRPNVETSTWAIPLVIEHTEGMPRVRFPGLSAAAKPQTAKFIGIDPTTGLLGTLPIPPGGGIDWNSLGVDSTPADGDQLILNTASGQQKITRKVFLADLLNAANSALKFSGAIPTNPMPLLFLAAGTANPATTLMYNPSDKLLYFMEQGQGKAYQYSKDGSSAYYLGYSVGDFNGYTVGVSGSAALRLMINGMQAATFSAADGYALAEFPNPLVADGIEVGNNGLSNKKSAYLAVAQDDNGATTIDGTVIKLANSGQLYGLTLKPVSTGDPYKYRTLYIRDDGVLCQYYSVSSSSERYKRDITDAEIDAEAWIKDTRIRRYYYKDVDYEEGVQPHFGLIAEELHDVPTLREMVVYSSTGRQWRKEAEAINNEELPFWNLAGLQYLYGRIEMLEAKLAAKGA